MRRLTYQSDQHLAGIQLQAKSVLTIITLLLAAQTVIDMGSDCHPDGRGQ